MRLYDYLNRDNRYSPDKQASHAVGNALGGADLFPFPCLFSCLFFKILKILGTFRADADYLFFILQTCCRLALFPQTGQRPLGNGDVIGLCLFIHIIPASLIPLLA